ncbi:MAG TPA: acyl-CoA dehydrogenase, partial [Anaeromyxobacter sp.]
LQRALATEGAAEALAGELERALRAARDPALRPVVDAARSAAEHARAFLAASGASSREAGARHAALTLGRAVEAALLAEHAQGCLDSARGRRALAAARRLARNGLDLLGATGDPAEAELLAGAAEA